MVANSEVKDGTADQMSHFWTQNNNKERERQQKFKEQFEQKKRERGIQDSDRIPLKTARPIGKEIESEHPELVVVAVWPCV